MNLASAYRNLSIKVKLRLVILLSGMVAMTLTCGAVLAYDRITMHAAMQADLETLAENHRNQQHGGPEFRRSKGGG